MKEKLSNLQISSLISSSFQRTNRIPQSCRRNSIFAINTGVLKKLNDCLSDLNGKFPFKIEGRIHTVEIKKAVDGWGIRVLNRKKSKIESSDQYHLAIHRDRNKHGLVRNLWYLTDANEIVLQYYIDRKICEGKEELEFIPESHGNSKSGNPYYRKKSSLLHEIRSATITIGEKRTSAHQIIKNVKLKGILDFGDIPRSKKQIYDLAKSNQGNKMGEVESILVCNAELEQEEIIWFHRDLPSDLWVCGTKCDDW